MIALLNSLYGALASLWEMSLTAAYAAAIVIVLRFVLKKRAPKQVLCLLWLVVFARLLIPVNLESPLSILPDEARVQAVQELPAKLAGAQATPAHNPGQNPNQVPEQAGGGTAGNPAQGNPNAAPLPPTLSVPGGVTPNTRPQPQAPAGFPWQALLAGVWLAGAIAMCLHALVSYLRLKHRLFDAIRAKDGAWEHPNVDSPFILGVFRPRIYLPAGLVGQPRKFILCHERAHLRRRDHIIKPVCWIALALHWFNPLVWAAFILMSRDIESACDEAVVRRLGSAIKADYSTTLLALATGRRVPAPSPLAFDEGDAKGRIKNVLRYRRPALWVIVVSAVMAVAAAVCLLTDPVEAEAPEGSPSPSPTVSAELPPENLADTLLDPWMREVLDGERQFISAYSQYNQGDGRTYGIHDLRSFYHEFPGAVVEVGRVAILDLDRDGINELVIWPEDANEYLYSVVGYAILRRQGDEIYGYNPSYRTFGNLKSDGTFHWSSSAAENGAATLTFGPGEIISHDTTYRKPVENGIDLLYFVDGQKATQEEYAAAESWEVLKPDVAWFTYEDGKLAPYLPAGAELLAEASPDSEAGTAKLWQGEYDRPYLEWNGTTHLLGPILTAGMSPALLVRDFDGDGQNEVVIQWMDNGFARYDVYEWNGGALAFADTFDSQNLLLRFNQTNVAGYNADSRGLTVTYSHVEGDPDSEDYYRHFVTGSCTLPEGFFTGYEHIRDGYVYAYANQFRPPYLDDANQYNFNFEFYLADETMQKLDRVDTLLNSDYSFHYMAGKPVGMAYFFVRYDGTKWVVQEPDQLNLDFQSGPAVIDDITAAAPLSAPVRDIYNAPDDPNEWYKAAELPDDMIWMYTRSLDGKTLIRWDGNFYKVFDHLVRSPQLKKLGGPDTYGPLAIISSVGSGTGVSLDELVVYDLDASDPVDYTHNWRPLVDEFNASRTFQYDENTHTVICTYEGQTAELIIDGSEEIFRRIDEEGVNVRATGEIVTYQFNDDDAIEVRFPLEAFIGDDVAGSPLLWPWFLRWTIHFNSETARFETVPGSCELFTYAGQ